MIVLICGSRFWTDEFAVDQVVGSLTRDEDVHIIHGGAQGADSMAGAAALRRNMHVRVFPAAWSTYGRRAGPIRNQTMLDKGKPDFVIYFTNDLELSRGTRDMVTRARKAGLPAISHLDWLEHYAPRLQASGSPAEEVRRVWDELQAVQS